MSRSAGPLGLIAVATLVASVLTGCTYKRSFGVLRTSTGDLQQALTGLLTDEGYEVDPATQKGRRIVLVGRSAADGEDLGIQATFVIGRRDASTSTLQMKARSRQHWPIFWWESKPHATEHGQVLAERVAERFDEIVVAPPAGAGSGQTHYVLVGVSRYRESDFPDLLAAKSAIERVRTDLESGGVEASRMTILIDRDANLSQLRETLHRIASSIGADDAIVVFFSGYVCSPNEGSFYCVPYDGRLRSSHGTMFTHTSLSAALEHSGCRRQLVIVDGHYVEGTAISSVDDRAFLAWTSRDRVLLTSTDLRVTRADHDRSTTGGDSFASALAEALSTSGSTSPYDLLQRLRNSTAGEADPQAFGAAVRQLRINTK